MREQKPVITHSDSSLNSLGGSGLHERFLASFGHKDLATLAIQSLGNQVDLLARLTTEFCMIVVLINYFFSEFIIIPGNESDEFGCQSKESLIVQRHENRRNSKTSPRHPKITQYQQRDCDFPNVSGTIFT